MLDLQFLSGIFKECDIELTTKQMEKFETYAKLLVEWNEKINLTAITEPDEISEKHFLDSVLPF